MRALDDEKSDLWLQRLMLLLLLLLYVGQGLAATRGSTAARIESRKSNMTTQTLKDIPLSRIKPSLLAELIFPIGVAAVVPFEIIHVQLFISVTTYRQSIPISLHQITLVATPIGLCICLLSICWVDTISVLDRYMFDMIRKSDGPFQPFRVRASSPF